MFRPYFKGILNLRRKKILKLIKLINNYANIDLKFIFDIFIKFNFL